MTADDWLAAALTDDAVVVELLLRLKQPSESFVSKSAAAQPLVLPVGWGKRRLRSKPVAVDRKERESTRYSPTTPLSWNCGGGAASSPGDSDHSSGGRSKGNFALDTGTTAVITTGGKRSRKKKTLSELKEEENLLLKERIHLNKELAMLRVTLEEQKARSQNLKKLKLDMHLLSSDKNMASTSDDLDAVNSSHLDLAEVSALAQVPVSQTIPPYGDCLAHSTCKVEKEVDHTRERCFILPDLNMTPLEEDAGFDL